MAMQQDPHVVAELIKSLNQAKNGGGGAKTNKKLVCKKNTYSVAGSKGVTVDSYKFLDHDYKRDDLPTYARGLFTSKRSDGIPEIVSRGYDKFFNVDEVNSTKWENIEANTVGPYELSVKENGCIIFMSGLEDGNLLVCSKHSTGTRHEVDRSHAQVGEEWVEKHVQSVGKTTRDLALALRAQNLTAVAELCDDDFEEHVLEYPPNMAGLYIHGLNYNLPEFATMPGADVHKFADAWGFKKAQYITINDIGEVKSYLEKCAETGSWDGRDTEGFVVRCKTRGSSQHSGPDWFFKYKFEEPYLMYRQWREATKAVIAGRPPKYRKHKKITEEYLLFARRQLARDPKLGKEYNLNHGIIKMRDDFLAEKGQKGSDIIREEEAQGDEPNEHVNNIVLVPIATIGCGKTTVANALVKLCDFGHVQNDNVEGTKGRPQKFALLVMNAMAGFRVVIADRNNHQRRERAQIIDDISKVVPDAKFVALHWVHEPKSEKLSGIRDVTRQRVFERGDNHQTIRVGSKGRDDIITIMEGFLGRFEGCDTSRNPDANFDEVIDLDVEASSLENLETIISKLYNAFPKVFTDEMPSPQDMEDAIEWSLGRQVSMDKKHDLNFNKSPRVQKQPHPASQNGQAAVKIPTPQQLLGQLEYFSIPVLSKEVTGVLESVFSNASAEEKRMYNQLKQTRRVQSEFHVTLIHRATAKDSAQIWQTYTNAYGQAISQANLADAAQRAPALGLARLRMETLVWDDRVMAMVVRILPSPDGSYVWPCANAVAHVTIGTASADVKPKESNDLLSWWSQGASGGAKIWEREVPGMKVIDSVVKPVFQRGRG